jgi:hypothetical protein
MEEATRSCGKLHNELRDLYCLPNIIRVITSRRMGWPVVAHTVVKRKAYRILGRKHEGRRPLENLGIDGRQYFSG